VENLLSTPIDMRETSTYFSNKSGANTRMSQPKFHISIAEGETATLTDFINLYRGKRSRQISFKVTPQQQRNIEAYAVAFEMSRAELVYRGFLATMEHLHRYHPLPANAHQPGPPVQQLSLFGDD